MFSKINFSKFIIPIGLLISSFQSFANEATNKAGQATKPNTIEQFFPFIILGLLFYFFLIRPQQRRRKEHGGFLSNLKRGDEVLTNSGIYGRIEGITDQFVILEIAESVNIRVLKSQISSYTEEKEAKKSQTKKIT